MRKCLSHLDRRSDSLRVFFQMIWRQLSHFTQRPSVRIFFSPEASSSPELAFEPGHWKTVLTIRRWSLAKPWSPRSILYTALGLDTFFIGVLDLPHLGHGVG